jgi:hypothetical protein
MLYPSRPVHVLPQSRDTNPPRDQPPEQRQRLLEFVATEYRAGRSLGEPAELCHNTTVRTQRWLGWDVMRPELAPLAAPREPRIPRGGHLLTPAGGPAGSSGCVSVGDGGPGALPRHDRALEEPAPRTVHGCLPQHGGWGGAGRDELPRRAVGCPGVYGMTRYRDGVHAENSPYVRRWSETSLRDRPRSLHP